jgi:hypothetical protein
MADIVDPPPEAHSHHHATGHRWLDLTLAISAIVISSLSAILAFQHGAAMERMVQQNAHLVEANTWPYLSPDYSTTNEHGDKLFKVEVTNNGVGPARIGTFRILYNGKPVKDFHVVAREIANDVGHADDKAVVTTGDMVGVLPARSTAVLLGAQAPYSAEWMIDALQAANRREQFDVEICYCSILNDCWTERLRGTEPQPVKTCG